MHCLCERGTWKQDLWFDERRQWVLQRVQDPCISIEGEYGECFISHHKWQKPVLETLVSLVIEDTNNFFLSQVGEDLSKYTTMDIMDKVNRTTNTSTEGIWEAAYVRKIPTEGTEVIDEFEGGDPGSTAKRLKIIFASRYGDHSRSSNIKVYQKSTGKFESQCRFHCWGSGKHLLSEQQDWRLSRRPYNNLVRDGIHN